jgi:transcriptional regulator with GAF, ATPase, and Fis domain
MLFRNEEGRPCEVSGISTDITERKEAERALERAYQEIQALKDQLQDENIALREEVDKTSMFEEIVGTSPALHTVLANIAKVAPTDSTVLITGETGTGKELVARAIHKHSARAGRPFVSVNCAAIPPALIASELFGHERGAFTGAVARREGRFELAAGGTLFLDEVGELPAETQVALLRVLQEHEFERVGSSRPIRADVRIIAATNRDLHTAIAEKTFRADLFYRLNVFPMEVPALRDRGEDIALLVEYFTHRFGNRAAKRINAIPKATLDALQAYDWPGNIRELQNVIERAVILSDGSELSVDLRWLSPAPAVTSSTSPVPASSNGKTLLDHERSLIESALEEAMGRVAGPFGAATKLGMPPSTLESKLKVLKIEKSRFKPVPPSRNHEFPSRGFREAS